MISLGRYREWNRKVIVLSYPMRQSCQKENTINGERQTNHTAIEANTLALFLICY
jgi:hypothetical protein